MFEEIDTISVAEKAELVAILVHSFLIVCCYRQTSYVDVALLTNLGHLLDKYPQLSPVICGEILMSTNLPGCIPAIPQVLVPHATLDFCESRGLHQLVTFLTHLNAILDLVMTEYSSSFQALPNLSTSDHVAVLLTLSSFTHVVTPASCRVYHWSRTPWGRLHYYFHSFC